MKNKKTSLLLALILTISAFVLPMTAYAASPDTMPPRLSASLNGDTLKVESTDEHSGVEAVYVDGNRINSLTNGTGSVALKDYAGTDMQVSVYAEDYAGNRSDIKKFDNPYYEEPKETSSSAVDQTQIQGTTIATKPVQSTSTESITPQSSIGSTSAESGSSESNDLIGTTDSEETTSSIPDGAFTPEGSGTILDSATENVDDKQFYTINTDAGNVFYLIVDGKRDDNNVYFLNGVTESDLMALAEKSDGSVSAIPAEEVCICTDKCENGAVDTNCSVCKLDLKGCKGKETPSAAVEPAEPKPQKKENDSVGTILFILAALLAVGGVGYYVKIVRPKKMAEDDEDLDDGYGEGFDPDAAFGEPEYLSEDDFDDKDSE